MDLRIPLLLLPTVVAVGAGCDRASGPAPPPPATVQVHVVPAISARIVATPSTLKPGETVTLHLAADPEAEYKRWAYDIDWTATDRSGNCIGKFTVGPNDVAMMEGDARTFRAADVKWTAPDHPCIAYIHAYPCIQASASGDYEGNRRHVPIILRVGNARYVPPRLTAEKAVDIATRFCEGLVAAKLSQRKPDPTDADAMFPTNAVPGLPPDYRLSTWKVTFRDGTEVALADEDGRITSFADPIQMDREGKPGPPISKARAMALASKTIALAGFSQETGTPQGNWSQNTYPPTSAGLNWFLSAPRLFHPPSGPPIPYADEAFNVILGGDSGLLDAFGVPFRLPEPPWSRAVVTADQAAATARALLDSKGLSKQVQNASKPRLVVSAPTSFWQDGNPEPKYDRSNVTWHCAFSAAQWYATVEVDAATGQVVGGEHSVVRGGRRHGGTPGRG
jgi:hypothetical protein